MIRSYSKVVAAAIFILATIAALTLLNIKPLDLQAVTFLQEKVELSVQPSAANAYGFGMKHFSSSVPAMHNIDYAEYFFQRALAMDPNYHFVHQQLARIAFLKGDFNTAMEQINTEISLQGDNNPSAYYIRGLIEGTQGSNDTAIADYAHFLSLDPSNWAGYNDYAWVLVKSKHYHKAAKTLDQGLEKNPANPWLLNLLAATLYELHDITGAKAAASAAVEAANSITVEQWIKANPGNDPKIATAGIQRLKSAALQNLVMISLAATSSVAVKK